MSTESKSIESEEFWEQHSIAWKASGLSQKEYCKQASINFARFIYKHNLMLKKSKPAEIKFIQAKPALPNTNQVNAGLQLMLPNGIRVGISNEVNINLLQSVLTLAGSLKC